jgi:hypothetical protein
VNKKHDFCSIFMIKFKKVTSMHAGCGGQQTGGQCRARLGLDHMLPRQFHKVHMGDHPNNVVANINRFRLKRKRKILQYIKFSIKN